MQYISKALKTFTSNCLSRGQMQMAVQNKLQCKSQHNQ